jgi:exopolyphosphatase / guanosine-5'-triphosphate,3'-diphosphate pyrophosphatase
MTGSPIVPRWEWRTFGERLGAGERRLAALAPESVAESEELYLLSAADGDTVKVRDGLLDVKRLEQVDEDGLEQWRPVLKAAFPVPADDIGSVLAELKVATPARELAAYTLDQLLDQLVRPADGLVAVNVHKRRQRFSFAGCAAELTDVRTGDRATRTIAVESEDRARVLAAVRELGLALRPNVNYPRGLRALLGLGARRFAVIDVGTNSVNVHVAELGADGAWRTIADRAEITRLGEGLDETGRLGAEPIERTVAAIAALADEARENGVEAIAAVGTAGLRIAPNAAELVAAARARAGVAIEIIPGEEEARLAYLAARSALGPEQGSLVVFDTGGGSTQLTFGHGERVEEQFSVDVGSVRFTERFALEGTVSEDALRAALDAIALDLARLDGRPQPDALVAIGGAATNLAAVKHGLTSYDPDVVQGTELDRAEIDRQIDLYRLRSADERRAIVGLQPGRADIILAGACIVRTVMEKLGAQSLVVSDRALRHGLLVERFGPR